MGLIFRVFAFACFVLAAVGINGGKFSLTAAGLAFLTASMIFP
jgi:hypothetical protein